MLFENLSMTTENNDIGKIAKSFLFIGNLLLINFVIGEFIQEPTTEFYNILWRLVLFFVAIVLTGSMIHLLKPKTVKIAVVPIFIIALFFAVI